MRKLREWCIESSPFVRSANAIVSFLKRNARVGFVMRAIGRVDAGSIRAHRSDRALISMMARSTTLSIKVI
jgi:hypothetical protein